jgi:hypothetical protein
MASLIAVNTVFQMCSVRELSRNLVLLKKARLQEKEDWFSCKVTLRFFFLGMWQFSLAETSSVPKDHTAC